MKRRTLCSLLATSLLGAASGIVPGLALAQDAARFPEKPITIVVPFPAGGTADVLPRIVGQKLTEKWGQPVIVENRSGAGGNIGAQAVAKSAADGYTLLATPPGPLTINKNLYKSLGYEPDSLVPVTVLASVPNVLAVKSSLPVSSVKEFIDYAAKNSGKTTVATQGNGATSHLTAAMFANQADVKFTFVPYKGTAPALVDLMAGQVDAFFDNLSSSFRHHEAGKLKILAVAGGKRSPVLPNVPTIAESGLPRFESTTWFGVVAPEGTPPEIVKKINGAIVEILNDKEVQRKFLEQGAEIVGNSPADMAKFLAEERSRWKKVIQNAGVTMN